LSLTILKTNLKKYRIGWVLYAVSSGWTKKWWMRGQRAKESTPPMFPSFKLHNCSQDILGLVLSILYEQLISRPVSVIWAFGRFLFPKYNEYLIFLIWRLIYMSHFPMSHCLFHFPLSYFIKERINRKCQL
jgi:hypothetical protein